MMHRRLELNQFMVFPITLLSVIICMQMDGFAQCNAIPAQPATTPTHALLPTDGNLVPNATYSLVSANQTLSSNVGPNTDNTNSNIYINAGRTLTVGASGATRNFNNSTGKTTTIYIKTGGTLTVNGDLNGTIIYVYGTLNVTGNLNNTNNIYVASSGTFNATGTNFNVNDSNLYVEGVMNVTNNLNQFQSSRACMNNGGCIRANNVKTVNITNFINTAGNGLFYYSGTSCDFAGSNNNLTSDASLKICANFAGPCSRLGTGNITYNCNPASGTCAGAIALPVIIAHFYTEKRDGGVKLNWATVRQSNTAHFVIEKSTNGVDWKEVGRLEAEDARNEMQEYSIMDSDPTSGQTYYRLKEVDRNKNSTVYSTIIEDFATDFGSFLLYPNPANRNLNVFLSNEFPSYEMQIVDSRGTLVATYTLWAGENKLEDIAPSGLYLAKLKVGSETKVQKFIIQ